MLNKAVKVKITLIPRRCTPSRGAENTCEVYWNRFLNAVWRSRSDEWARSRKHAGSYFESWIRMASHDTYLWVITDALHYWYMTFSRREFGQKYLWFVGSVNWGGRGQRSRSSSANWREAYHKEVRVYLTSAVCVCKIFNNPEDLLFFRSTFLLLHKV